jgi:hypothetical protein
MMSGRLRFVAASALALSSIFGLSVGVVSAHAQYASSTPSANATVAVAPSSVQITYTQELSDIRMATPTMAHLSLPWPERRQVHRPRCRQHRLRRRRVDNRALQAQPRRPPRRPASTTASGRRASTTCASTRIASARQSATSTQVRSMFPASTTIWPRAKGSRRLSPMRWPTSRWSRPPG